MQNLQCPATPLRFKPLLGPILWLLVTAGCAHSAKRPPGLDEASSKGRQIETIAIVGTNDLHGTLVAQNLKTREADPSQSVAYRAGGMATIAAYLEILRSEFGAALLWLDAGDEFQGSIESNLEQGAPMTRVFNRLGPGAAAVGNHEFDYGASTEPGADPADVLGALKSRMAQANYPYLGANIRSKATGQFATAELPLLRARHLIDTGKIKVGVIGLTTLETPRSTTGAHVRDLEFADLKDATLREARALKQEGADIVVITAHVGLRCERGRVPPGTRIRAPNEPQGDCGANDEMVQLLKSLPSGTVDAVVAGHSHQVVHHWVAGIPVIQGGAFGRYLNVVYLSFDLKERKLMTDYTRIEGPVPVCPKVFQNQSDCNGDRPAPKGGRGPLVPAHFHGETIEEDPGVLSMLEPTLEKSRRFKNEVIATAARPVEHDRTKESEIGNLVADAMRDITGAQVAVMNSGGIRAPWDQGPITYEAVFRTLPFDNQVIKVRVTGKELRQILEIAESGSRGFFSTSGVRMRVIPLDTDAPGRDLNRDGRIEEWEVNRILDLKLEDGSPILDDREYTLATIDFLLGAGDDLGWIMKQLPLTRQDPPVMLVRDAVIARMRALSAKGPLNSVEHPFVNPSDPRIRFERPQGKKKYRRGRIKTRVR